MFKKQNQNTEFVLPKSSKLFKDTLIFFKEHWAVFVKLLLIPFIPLIFVGLIAEMIQMIKASVISGVGGSSLILLNIFAFLLIGIAILIQIVVSLLVAISMILAVSSPKMEVKKLLKKSLPLFWSFLWIQILVTAIISIASLAFIIPGLIFVVFYLFAGFVFVYEGVKGYPALHRSMKLVNGFWLSIVLKMIPWIVIGFLLTALNILPYFGIIGTLISSFIIPPLMIIYLKLMYDEILKFKKLDTNAKEKHSVAFKITVTIILILILIGIFALPNVIASIL